MNNESAPRAPFSYFSGLKVDPADGDSPAPLLSRAAFSPRSLLLFGALPFLILFCFNLSTYLLFVADLELPQHVKWAGMNGANLAVIACYVLGYFRLRSQDQPLRGKTLFLALGIPIGFLTCATMLSGSWSDPLIPRDAARWLITDDTFMVRQLTFTMPSILLSVVLLGGFPAGGLGGKDNGDAKVALYSLVGGGILFALFYAITQTGLGGIGGAFAAIFILLLISAIGVLIAVGLIRLLLVAIRAAAHANFGSQLFLALLITIVLPITGLIVNYHIPFPATFQSTTIYTICTLNALALLIPTLGSPRIEFALWLIRCCLFAFTLYFVGLYLPFLPLAVPALIVYGAGFLLLAPCLLMLFQWTRIREGFERFKNDLLPARSLAIIGIAALFVLPLGFLARTTFDRLVLHRALDQLFTPAQGWNPETESFTSENTIATTNPAALRRALDSLIRIKHGEYLPFMTPLYNRIVFDGLILPNDKIDHAYAAFFGEDKQPEFKPGTFSGARTFGQRGGSTNNIDNPRPHTDVSLTDIATDQTTTAPITQTEATLTVTNNKNAIGEFTTEIELPPSAIVTDFALMIDEEWKPGKIFEQKSALWVYQQIRDTTNADPSILYYREPGHLNLRIFPVLDDAPRQVRFTISTPTGNTAPLIVGDQSVNLAPEDATASELTAVIASDASGTSSILPPSALGAPIQRTPYLHLIHDYSGDSIDFPKFINDESALTLDHLMEKLGTESHIESACNYRATLLTNDSRPKKRGGFVRSEALRHALAHGLQRSSENPDSYPIIVLAYDEETTTPTDAPGASEGILALAEQIPDTAVYYHWDTRTSTLKAYDFKGEWRASKDSLAQRKVHLLRPSGASTTPFAFLPSESATMAHWFGNTESETLETLNSEGNWSPLASQPTTLQPDIPFAQSLASYRLRQRERIAVGGGALSGIALASAKASKTLVPGTTFLVMDTSWQWKAAQQAEKKKMKGHKALEMTESDDDSSSNVVPEPSQFLLLLIGLTTILLQRRR